MSRMSQATAGDATGATAQLFEQIKKASGKVPNAYASLATHYPQALQAMLGADAALSQGTLERQDHEIIKLVVSEAAGCDYCVAAHTLVGKLTGLPAHTMAQVRHGEPTGDERRDALVRFVRTLLATPGTLSDEGYSDIVEAGFTPQQLVEISLVITVITFTNLFNRINDTTLDFPPVK